MKTLDKIVGVGGNPEMVQGPADFQNGPRFALFQNKARHPDSFTK